MKRYANPTPLRLGAMGVLHGWRVRVVGRVVMGMDDGGETYHWNEFNLVDDAGTNGTLVYEETDDGPQWKLFTTFVPVHAITAQEAAAKRVGHMVTLDGTPAKITLVDQSRVYHIEGTAPEGTRIGDVANYFNADDRDRMLVVTWSGDEIEFYEGRELRVEDVAAAFQLSNMPARRQPARQGVPVRYLVIAGVVLCGVIAIGLFSSRSGRSSSSRPPPPAPKRVAPALRLPNGAQATLRGQSYKTASQAVVEVARVGMRHERREYLLRGENGRTALLIQSLDGAAKEWHLFSPVPPPAEFSSLPPYAAAAQRRGATIHVAGISAPILQLFLAKRIAMEGEAARSLGTEVQYGFLARRDDDWVIAQWTESAIQFYRGAIVPESEVVAAFRLEVSYPK